MTERERFGGFLAGACLELIVLTACTQTPPSKAARPPVPLPAVSPLPAPALPAWIAQISPVGPSNENDQIRVRFNSDIVKVEALSSDRRQRVLDAFALEPPLPGRFVIYTPRLIAYETDAALPPASRFRVTLRAGLSDLAGDRLDHDVAWTFRTTPLQLSGLPAQEADAEPPVVDVQPEVRLTSNAALDRATLEARTEFVPQHAGGAQTVGVTAAEATPSPLPSPADVSDAEGERVPANFSYLLKPRTALAGGTSYRIVVHAGVAPAAGNLPSTQAFSGRLRARGPLAFTRVEPYERPADSDGTGRFIGGAPQ